MGSPARTSDAARPESRASLTSGRRRFLRLGAASAGLGLLVGCGVRMPWEPVRRLPMVGWMTSGEIDGAPASVVNFRAGLRELGYIEGESVDIRWRFSGNNTDEGLLHTADEFVRVGVDVIVASGAPAARAARRVTEIVPIVAVLPLGNIVRSGLAVTLNEPGGNVTGLQGQVQGGELWEKRFALLREIVPAARRVAYPRNMQRMGPYQPSERIVALGFMVDIVEVPSPERLEEIFASRIAGRAEALAYTPSDFLTTNHKRVAELALAAGLPSISDSVGFARAGGMLGYSPDFPGLYRRAAYFVARILQGVRPGDLPIEQPARFALVINLQTATALNLTVPEPVMRQATAVIE